MKMWRDHIPQNYGLVLFTATALSLMCSKFQNELFVISDPLVTFFLNTFIHFFKSPSEPIQKDDQIGMLVPEIIPRHGYSFESHKVETSDGFLLTLHRIPHGRHWRHHKRKKRAILIQHGLYLSSVDWLAVAADRALPFLLADDGYDVWLSNTRGNEYSPGHTSLTQDDLKYWDFSVSEIGSNDLPAIIDYILDLTGHHSLSYMGHSLGTTAFFIAMSTRPHYNKKVHKMVALSPSVYMTHTDSIIGSRIVDLFFDTIAKTSGIGGGEMLPFTKKFRSLGSQICNGNFIEQALCNAGYVVFSGDNVAGRNRTTIARATSFNLA